MEYVWLVEAGAYSDYHVIGVYSSEKNAQCVVEAFKKEDPWHRKVVVDECINRLLSGESLYWVRMQFNGDCDLGLTSCFVEEKEQVIKPYRNFIFGHVWAKSREHAIKIVNEKRIQMIASGELKAE